MNISTPIPTTIQLRRSRLVGLMAAVAALAAAITWALLIFAVDRGAEQAAPAATTGADAPSLSTREYVEGIAAMTPEQLAAAFGNLPFDTVAQSATERQAYAEAIASLTPEQLAAAFGNVPVDVLSSLGPTQREYVEGIMALSPEQLAAGFGNSIQDMARLAYVEAIAALRPEELAAAYGR